MIRTKWFVCLIWHRKLTLILPSATTFKFVSSFIMMRCRITGSKLYDTQTIILPTLNDFEIT